MKVHQLSLFVENRPGQLTIPCRALAAAGINILTLSLADTQQFGILRLIIRDWERAKKVLEKAGCVVNVTEMVAVEVPDRPGGLAEVLSILSEEGISIEYLYSFVRNAGKNALLIFRVEELERAAAVLTGHGVTLISQEQVRTL